MKLIKINNFKPILKDLIYNSKVNKIELNINNF